VENRLEVYKYLKKNGIEACPLICGSMGRQPFWMKRFKELHLPIADIVHDNGIYLPNHLNINIEKIDYISKFFLEIAKPLVIDKKSLI
jgi:CDP-6-deoxy-D-xylo-4-hexulose-3-dehydrase